MTLRSSVTPPVPQDGWVISTTYGSVGNGVADDTVALQAMLDSGRPCRIYPGTYKIGAAGLNITTAAQVVDCSGAKFTSMGGPIRIQALRVRLVNFAYTGSDALSNGVIIVGDPVTGSKTSHYWEIDNPQITATGAKYGIVIANGSYIGNIFGGSVFGNAGVATANSRGLFLGEQVQSVNCWGTNFVAWETQVEMRGCDGIGLYQCDLGDGPAAGYYILGHAVPTAGDASPFGTNVYPNGEGSWWGIATEVIGNLIVSGCYMEQADVAIYIKSGLQLKSSTFTSNLLSVNNSSPNAKVGTRIFKTDIPIAAVTFTGNNGVLSDYVFEINSGFVTGLFSINNIWDDVGRGTAHAGTLSTGSGSPERVFTSEVDGNGYMRESCARGRVIGASGDKNGFYGLATPIAQPGANVDPDTVLINLGLKASGGNGVARFRTQQIASINFNAAATDVATFTMPSKYRLQRFLVFDASVSLTTATVELRSAAAGGGSNYLATSSLAACTAPAKFQAISFTGAALTDYLTTSLYVRCVTAQGSAASASVFIEYEDLT